VDVAGAVDSGVDTGADAGADTDTDTGAESVVGAMVSQLYQSRGQAASLYGLLLPSISPVAPVGLTCGQATPLYP
jgi:hypothetical protein